MQLVEEGKIRVNEPVAKYLPDFAQNDKQDITIRQLLTHFSGITEDLDLTEHWQGRDTALKMAYAEKPIFPPGSKFLYSDINFITLGALVEHVSGTTLDQYCEKNIFKPLKMTHTRFVPPAAWRARIAPTQYDEDNKMLRGVVHDPTARRMGGVAGHAGLVLDCRRSLEIRPGSAHGKQRLAAADGREDDHAATAALRRQSCAASAGTLTLPFPPTAAICCPLAPSGTRVSPAPRCGSIPTTRTYIILLTNAVHPRGGNAISLRSKMATRYHRRTQSEPQRERSPALEVHHRLQRSRNRRTPHGSAKRIGEDWHRRSRSPPVRRDQRQATSKKHIGLLTNQTGIDAQGQRTIDVLAHAPGVSLDAIFSPEHGVTGTLDTTDITNSKDSATGIPVYSVYGAKDAARRPSIDVLKTLDAVVVDLQDAGVRFYTYETTLGYFLEAAAKAGIEIIVLDRPNPDHRIFRARATFGSRAAKISRAIMPSPSAMG